MSSSLESWEPVVAGQPSPSSAAPGLPRHRAVALVVVLLTTVGAALLLPARESATEVPPGAQPGDLTFVACEVTTEVGPRAADCGTLVVPENRSDPGSRLIALPVTRFPATGPDPLEPVLVLNGGPGQSNLDFPAASRFTDRHDVVLVGYRGIDGSSVLDCPEVATALRESTDALAQATQIAYAEGLGRCAERLAANGADLAGYSLTQRVADLEDARRALGVQRVSLISESAGTRTAMVYAARYPGSVHRSVMIGVNPPGRFLWDPAATDQQLERYAALCTQDAACSVRTDDLVETLRTGVTEPPDRWQLWPIHPGSLRVATTWGMFVTRSDTSPLDAATTVDAWLDATEGDSSGLWAMSTLVGLLFPDANVWGDLGAIGAEDFAAVDAFYAGGGDAGAVPGGSVLGGAGTDYLWAGGRVTGAWPPSPDAGRFRQVPTSEVETLVVSGALDLSTPPQNAELLMPSLPNGQHVELAGFGHVSDFWSLQPEAARRLVATFLADGVVDDSVFAEQPVSFQPDGPTFSDVARVLLAVLVGFPPVAMLLLGATAWRVRRRVGLGRPASTVLRVLLPVTTAAGAWAAAVLLVWGTSVPVPVVDPVLVVTTFGLGAALGAVVPWGRRDRPRAAVLAGTAAAALTAAAAAWLSVQAAGPAGVPVALVGAVLGANLGLLVADALGLGSVRSRRRPPRARTSSPDRRRRTRPS